MMDWYARALDLPTSFIFEDSNGVGGGSLQNTASDGIFNSIVAARHQKIFELGGYQPKGESVHPAAFIDQLICYTSEESHSSVKKGARLAGCSIRLLTGNEQDIITGQIFLKAIDEDVSKNLIPLYICVSLGTTGGCAIDNLSEIGPICKERNIYCHVDAAYAGSAFILEEYRHFKNGMEYVDSLDINPYKFMLGAPDMSCLWVRNLTNYRRAFEIFATYLIQNDESKDDPNVRLNSFDYRHYGVPLTRRMRALKLWFLFRSYGVKGLQNYIRRLIKCAKLFESLIRKDERFEVMNDVHMALVCFRQKE